VVEEDDIKRVIGPCLSHRLRKDPMDAMDGSVKAGQRLYFLYQPLISRLL
jgi:hypothetical protein